MGLVDPLTSLLTHQFPSLCSSNASFSAVIKHGICAHASGPLHLLLLAWDVAFLEYLLGSLSYLRSPILPTGLPIPFPCCIPIAISFFF